MASFTVVATGNTTNATDINQLINAMNGTTACQVFFLATNASTTPVFGYLPATPSSDRPTVAAQVSSDATPRAALYLRSDGYGGLLGGNSGGITAHLRAGASGWTIDEVLTVVGAVALNGGGTVFGNNIMQGISTSRIFVQSVAPSSPQAGDIWIDTSVNLG